jgi:hypothetical protein
LHYALEIYNDLYARKEARNYMSIGTILFFKPFDRLYDWIASIDKMKKKIANYHGQFIK